MSAMILIYQALITLACAAMVAIAFTNLRFVARDRLRARRLSLPERPPRVSICIPARNESVNIGACVDSLARQQYPDFEILVLDDCSEDDTAARARAAAARHPGVPVRVIAGQPLPAGWIGKSWACHQASLAATGEYLLFTDADTVWSPRALKELVVMALDSRADLLSAPPRLDAVTIWERLSVPLLTLAGAGMLSLPLVSNSAMKDYAVASGACMFFRREAYDRIAGHKGVRAQIVEDLELARRLKRCRLKLHLTDGSRLARCRMYRSRAEVWEGFTKNYSKGFGTLLTPLVLAATLAIFVGPPLSFVFGPWLGWGWWAGTILPGLQVAIIAGLRAGADLRFGAFSWSGSLLTPAAAVFVVLIGLRSLSRTILKQPTPWRARHYEIWHRDPGRVRHL
ncbi:MAG: glycosyltransferase family 2 protein [Candidatus Sumerlaeia bacterium]